MGAWGNGARTVYTNKLESAQKSIYKWKKGCYNHMKKAQTLQNPAFFGEYCTVVYYDRTVCDNCTIAGRNVCDQKTDRRIIK